MAWIQKKANEILRLLEKYGWLEVETDKSYVQRVNFYDYAVKVMKTLLEISDGRKVEYQGYIYTIYSLVRPIRIIRRLCYSRSGIIRIC